MADLGVFIQITAAGDQASSELGKVGDALDRLSRQADQATRPLQSFTDLMAGGLGIAVGIKALDGLLEVFGGLKGAAVDLTANLERTQIALATLFQSQDQAAGMIAALKQLAATTPFYTQTLTAATQELAAMGIATTQILPLLKDIGTVAAASGGDTQQAFKRITLAVGELNTEQTAYTRQLNQLAIAGVPIFTELSQELGVTTGQIREMTKQGALSSDTVINALHNLANSPRYGDMLAQQAQTFNGALTTVKDNIAFLISDAFEPLFKVIEQGVVGFANLTKTDEWAAWGQAAHTAVQGLLDALTPLTQALAPAIQGVQQMFATLTQTGDVSTALAQLKDGVSQSLQTILAGITAFGRQMFGAGATLVTTFAEGMATAAGSVLTSTVTAIADTIASFLIGHSPPASGPLREIATGGRTLMETYGQGMQQGLDPVRQAVAGVSAELKNAGTDLGALKGIGLDVESQIHAVARAAHDIDSEIRSAQNAIRDVKDSYTAQLAPLEEQHHQLTAQRDTSLEIAQLANQLEGTQLRQAEALARGDSEQRAILSAQLQTYQAVEQEASLREQLLTTQQKLDDLGTESLRQQEQRNQLAEQEVTLRDRIAKDAIPDPRFAEQIASAQQRITGLQLPDLGYENRSQELAQQLAQLQGGGGAAAQLVALREAQQQRQLTQQARTATGPNAAQQRQQAQVGLAELKLQQQAAAEQKQHEIERVQQQQAQLEKEKQAADTRRAQEIADAQRRISDLQREAALALDRQQKDAAAAAAQLVSLDLRRQALDKQEGQEAAILQARKDQLETRQAEIGTQLELAGLVDQDQLAQVTQQEAINKAHEDTFNWLKQQDDAQRKILDIPILAQISALKDEEAARLAPLQAQLETYTRQKQAVTDQHTAWQEVKADLLEAEAQAKALEAANTAAAKAAGVGQGLTVGEIDPATQEAAQERAREAGQKLASALADGMQTWLQMHAGELIGGAIGAALGATVLGPIGAVIGATLGAAIGDNLQQRLSAEDISFFDALKEKLAGVDDAFEKALPYLQNFFQFLSEHQEIVLGVIAAFVTFQALLAGAAFIAATAAVIAAVGGVTLALGAISVAVGVLTAAWVGNWGDIQGKTKVAVDFLGAQFAATQQVLTETSRIFGESAAFWGTTLDSWGTNVASWIETTKPFFDAFGTFLSTGLTQLQVFFTNAVGFITTGIGQWRTLFSTDLGKLATDTLAAITKLGGDLVGGFQKGIGDNWAKFQGWLGDQLKGLLTSAQEALGIHSPSAVAAAMVGDPLGAGIMAGAEAAIAAGIPALVAQTQSMVDTLGAITQAARDKAVADARAMQAIVEPLLQQVQAEAAQLMQIQQVAAGGGGAYAPGGLPEAPGSTPGTEPGSLGLAGLGGGAGGTAGKGGTPPGGNPPGSTYKNVPPGLTLAQIFGNSAPGYGPVITEPTTTSLFSRPPSLNPNQNSGGGNNSQPFGGIVNATLAAGLLTPEQAAALAAVLAQYNATVGNTTGSDARPPVVISQQIAVTGTSPDDFIQQADTWLKRAQWQAGLA